LPLPRGREEDAEQDPNAEERDKKRERRKKTEKKLLYLFTPARGLQFRLGVDKNRSNPGSQSSSDP